MRRRTDVALGVLSAAALATCSPADDSLVITAPTVVPIQLMTSPDGSELMLVTVQLGNALPFQALLDTGSSGLRVLATAVPEEAFTSITATPVTYSYGDYDGSTQLTGALAYATMTMGALTTDEPIAVMRIYADGCPPAGPACESLGGAFEVVPAILGVGMRTHSSDDGIGNPIAQLHGAPPYVVHAPAASTKGQATLRIGRDPLDSLAFRTIGLGSLSDGATLANGTPVWNDAAIPCCMGLNESSDTYCSSSLWDTGNPVTVIATSSQPAPFTTELSAGTIVSVTIGSNVSPVASYDFVVGADPRPGVDLVFVEPPLGGGSINLGVTLFDQFDVLFDQARGVVGLAQR